MSGMKLDIYVISTIKLSRNGNGNVKKIEDFCSVDQSIINPAPE